MWPQRSLSLSYATVEGASPVQQITAAAQAGFDGVSLRPFPVGAPSAWDAGALTPALAADIREACRDTGIRLLDAEVTVIGKSFSPDDIARRLDWASALDFACLLTVSDSSDLGRVADQLALVAALAQPCRVRVAFEFMRFRGIGTLDEALSILGHRGCEDVGLVVDPLHLQRSGGTPADLARVPATRWASLQLCDAPATPPVDGDLAREARTARLWPGEGALPLDAVLAQAPDDVALAIEVPQAALVSQPVVERARRAFRAAKPWRDRLLARPQAIPLEPIATAGLPMRA